MATLNPQHLGEFGRYVPAVTRDSVTVNIRQARQVRRFVWRMARQELSAHDRPPYAQLVEWARDGALAAEETTQRRVTPETMYWALAEVLWKRETGGWPPLGVESQR